MSGGHFEYRQYILEDIINKIEETQADVNTKPTTEDEEWSYYNFVEDNEGFNLICNTAKFYLEMAQVLAHRLDWFLSSDDGEESFHQRTVEDVDKVLEKHKEIIEVLK